MSDYISRQAVLDEMDKRHAEGDYITKGFIKALPSVENKGEWIPVSERLPKIHQDIVLEFRNGELQTGFKAETEPYFYCHGVDGCYVEPENVIAWMPLPEPYKAEKPETCIGCTHPCVMYEPRMKACEKKGR